MARVGVALAGGLGVATLILSALGIAPLRALRVLAETVLLSRSGFVDMLLHAIPLLLIALGYALAYQARIWVVGGEGQFHLGAIAAAVVALTLPVGTPAGFGIPLAVGAAMLGGIAWSLIPGWLRAYREVNEVVSTLMLNFVGILMMEWLIRRPFRDAASGLAQTPTFPKAFHLPALGASRVHLGLLVALALAPLLAYVLYRSGLGYRVRAIGANPSASRVAGIDVPRTILILFALGGALGGLAGAAHVLGVTHRLLTHLSPDFGYTAIMVALLARSNPLAVVPTAFFFSALAVGSEGVQVEFGVPTDFMLIIMGTLVLFVLAGDVLWQGRARG
jgi:simple sugar transport system permease protein